MTQIVVCCNQMRFASKMQQNTYNLPILNSFHPTRNLSYFKTFLSAVHFLLPCWKLDPAIVSFEVVVVSSNINYFVRFLTLHFCVFFLYLLDQLSGKCPDKNVMNFEVFWSPKINLYSGKPVVPNTSLNAKIGYIKSTGIKL